MEQEIRKILVHLKDENISTEKAIKLIQVLHGNRKSVTCLLDRLPKDCAIFQNTSSHSCDNCGHFKP